MKKASLANTAIATAMFVPGLDVRAETPSVTALNLAPAAISWADRQKTPLEQMFAGMELKDQYNQPMDPALFSKGDVAIIFGFRGCKMCMGSETKPGIADTVAAMQHELLRQGKNIPIVVISVTPEEDRTKEQRQAYVTSYNKKGVKSSAEQNLSVDDDALDTAYLAGASKKQEERLLHIIYPPNEKAAENLQSKMGLLQDPNKAEQHSAIITLFVDGVQQKFADKSNAKRQNPGILALPRGVPSDIKPYQELGAEIARQFIVKARGISR